MTDPVEDLVADIRNTLQYLQHLGVTELPAVKQSVYAVDASPPRAQAAASEPARAPVAPSFLKPAGAPQSEPRPVSPPAAQRPPDPSAASGDSSRYGRSAPPQLSIPSPAPASQSPSPASPTQARASTQAQPTMQKPATAPDAAPGASHLERLSQQVLACTRCPLSAGRKQPVVGGGKVGAPLMVVVTQPAAAEDAAGRPFLGPEGELLARILETMFALKPADVSWVSMVKCRAATGRNPTFDELLRCRPYLDEQLRLYKPGMVILFGDLTARSLLELPDDSDAWRGRWHDWKGRPTMVTFGPQDMLTTPALKRPVMEAMQLVRKRLAELNDG